MLLAAVEEEYPDELRADFQQVYGLNLDGMGKDYTFAHAAVLLSQLPSDSRVSKATNPDNEWSEQTYLLNAIEYDLRVLIWQKTKDGQHNRNQPKPHETPGEIAKKRDRAKNFDKDLVDMVLGKEVDDAR